MDVGIISVEYGTSQLRINFIHVIIIINQTFHDCLNHRSEREGFQRCELHYLLAVDTEQQIETKRKKSFSYTF